MKHAARGSLHFMLAELKEIKQKNSQFTRTKGLKSAARFWKIGHIDICFIYL